MFNHPVPSEMNQKLGTDEGSSEETQEVLARMSIRLKMHTKEKNR
jgi:hypothetical protein